MDMKGSGKPSQAAGDVAEHAVTEVTELEPEEVNDAAVSAEMAAEAEVNEVDLRSFGASKSKRITFPPIFTRNLTFMGFFKRKMVQTRTPERQVPC